MLRKESAHADQEGRPIVTRAEESGGKMYRSAFILTSLWIDNVLDIYKPELKRLLWPLFVYSFLNLVADYYPRDSQEFFNEFSDAFKGEHEDDLRALQPVTLPEHLQNNSVAQLYRSNKYRLTMSNMSFQSLIQHLEASTHEGGTVVMLVMQGCMDIRTADRAASGSERSLAKLLSKQQNGDQDTPAEDEGIPGHNPGSANLSQNAPAVLSKLQLGPLPMETDLLEDVKVRISEGP